MYLYVFIFIILLLQSCKLRNDIEPKCNSNCTIIKGRLLTDGGNLPIANAPVEVSWSYYAFLGGEKRLKAKTITDNNGNYQLSFYPKDDEVGNSRGAFYINYMPDTTLYYSIDNYIRPIEGVMPRELKRDTTFVLKDYLIPKIAYLNMSISNPQELNQSFNNYFTSALYVSFSNFTPTFNYNGGKLLVIWQDYQNTPRKIKVVGNQEFKMETIKVKNGIRTEETQIFNIPAGQTQYLNVTY